MFPPDPVRHLLSGFLDLLFPPACLICARPLAVDGPELHRFCPECRQGMVPLPPARCDHCGRPFETPLDTLHTCALCRKRPPAYDWAASAGLYCDSLRQAVHRFKYGGRTELARPLADFMRRNLEPPFYPPEADLILPVPLHRRRLRQRGFNQALVLARQLCKEWEDRIVFNLLCRERWTEPQVSLKGRQRLDNVRGAFRLADPGRVRGRSVLLFDDVYTTGATVNECARVLRRAGATRILVLTLARVVRPGWSGPGGPGESDRIH